LRSLTFHIKLMTDNLWRSYDVLAAFCFLLVVVVSRGSPVSTVSDYGLDGRGSILDTGRGFSSSLCVQTGCGAHPASYTMGTRGKARPGRDADHSPPSRAEVKKE
jgi:hypothetical protein